MLAFFQVQEYISFVKKLKTGDKTGNSLQLNPPLSNFKELEGTERNILGKKNTTVPIDFDHQFFNIFKGLIQLKVFCHFIILPSMKWALWKKI